MKSKDQIFLVLQDEMLKMFDVSRANLTLDARLYEDLDIDSIDIVDLVVKVRELTGKRPDPERFKQIRTLGDIVDAVYELIN